MTLKPYKFMRFVREWISRHPISSWLVLVAITPMIVVLYPLTIFIEKMFAINLRSLYDGWILVPIYAVLVGLVDRWVEKVDEDERRPENSTDGKTD